MESVKSVLRPRSSQADSSVSAASVWKRTVSTASAPSKSRNGGRGDSTVLELGPGGMSRPGLDREVFAGAGGDCGLLIDRQHYRAGRWVQVQITDVGGAVQNTGSSRRVSHRLQYRLSLRSPLTYLRTRLRQIRDVGALGHLRP